MRKTRSILMVIAVALFAMASCKKDLPNNYGSVNPPVGTPASTVLAKIYGDLKSAPQTLTVTAGVQQTVFGAKKTKLTFYPNSFKDKDGNTITSGTITLKLVEIYKAGGMIANSAPTMSNGQWLTSGGEVNIRAYRSNGEEVYANKYGIGFAQPSSSSQPMQLFYGNNANKDSTVIWTPSLNQTGTTTSGTVIDSFQVWDVYYQFDSCANFNWINCDYFYNDPGPLTGLDALAPDTSFNSLNTMVFIVFPGINSAASMQQYSNAGNGTFSLSSSYFIPVGITVHIVSVTNKNGNYYYYELLNQTVTNGMSVTLSPQPQTLAYVQNALSQL